MSHIKLQVVDNNTDFYGWSSFNYLILEALSSEATLADLQNHLYYR